MNVADTLTVVGMVVGALGVLALVLSLAVAVWREHQVRKQPAMTVRMVDADAEWRVVKGGGR